jgi:membrane peptidoglycan carboxypeptidase
MPQKEFLPSFCRFVLIFSVFVLGFIVSPEIHAQKSKTQTKTSTGQKDKTGDKKTSQKEQSSKKEQLSKSEAKKREAERLAAEKRRQEEARRVEEERKRQEQARLAEERRRQEQARQATLEAQRRREQQRREAEARIRSVNQNLREETIENILHDDLTGEDLNVRRAAINALGDHAGTVVVLDPQTGRILSVVNQDWGLRKGFKPCSTIKLVTGIAGLNEGLIDQDGNISFSGGRSPLDLTDALAYSNNRYFQNVGGYVGYEKMMNYARLLGLGEMTGVNADGESPGSLPPPKTGFPLNRMSSHGDDFAVTPLQLATLVSAITNGGYLLTPHVFRTQNEQVSYRRNVRRQIMLSPQVMQGLIPGMIGAVNYGTGKLAFDSKMNIGGKTGSCIGQGSWLGLFASVAPVVNPKIAVVVVLRGSGERGKYAAGVAGNVYRQLGIKYTPQIPNNLAKTQPILNPRPKVDPKTAEKLSDEEDEEISDENTKEGDSLNNKNKVKKQTSVTTKPETTITNNNPIIVNSANPTVSPTPTKTRPRIVKLP